MSSSTGWWVRVSRSKLIHYLSLQLPICIRSPGPLFTFLCCMLVRSACLELFGSVIRQFTPYKHRASIELDDLIDLGDSLSQGKY